MSVPSAVDDTCVLSLRCSFLSECILATVGNKLGPGLGSWFKLMLSLLPPPTSDERSWDVSAGSEIP